MSVLYKRYLNLKSMYGRIIITAWHICVQLFSSISFNTVLAHDRNQVLYSITWQTLYKEWHQYTCQLFLSQRREIFNWRVPGFLKMTRTYPKFSKDFRRHPKMSEDVLNNSEVRLVHLSDPIQGSVSLNMTLFPMFFLSEIKEIGDFGYSESTVWYSFTFSITWSFRFSNWCKFTSFRKVFQFKLL